MDERRLLVSEMCLLELLLVDQLINLHYDNSSSTLLGVILQKIRFGVGLFQGDYLGAGAHSAKILVWRSLF